MSRACSVARERLGGEKLTNSDRNRFSFDRLKNRIANQARANFDYPDLSIEKLVGDLERNHKRFRALAANAQDIRRAVEQHKAQLALLERSKNTPLEELEQTAEGLLSEVQSIRQSLNNLQRQSSRLRHSLNVIKLGSSVLDDAVIPGLATLTKKSQDLNSLIAQLSDAKTELRNATIAFIEMAAWNQKVLLAKSQIQSGFSDVGVRALFSLAYGTEAPRPTRKAALTELIRWAKSIQRIALSQLFGYHLEFSKTKRTLERVPNLNFIAYEAQRKSAGQLERGEDYFILLESLRIDAGEQQADNLLWAANFVAKLERTIFGDDVSHEVQLQWMNASLKSTNLSQIDLEPGSSATLDRVTATCTKDAGRGQTLVSVILPAFNSELWISTAIQSLLSQTWRNLEVIVVDDCSTDATYSIAKSFEALDNRVKVLKAQTNSGPYHCRNLALRISTGEFVTVHDADDWSHPQKIEIQASHLLANSTVVANVSQGARLDESSLITGIAGRSQILRPNFSSLMFRREAVLERLGFWDEVRFGGDSEFQHRLESCFGEDSFVELKTGLLSLLRVLEGSLTAGGMQETLSGARRIYKDSFLKWHEYLIVTGQSFVVDPASTRRFYAPHASLGKPKPDQELDIVFVADFSGSAESNATRIELLSRAIASKLRVGLVHVPGLVDLNSVPSVEVEAFALENGIELLWHLAAETDSQEPIQTNHLIATDGASSFRYDRLVPVAAKETKLLLEDNENGSEKQLAVLKKNFEAMFGQEPSIVQAGQEALAEVSDIRWLADLSKD